MFIGTGLGIGEAGGVPAVPRTLAQLQAQAVWVFSLRKVVSTYAGNCIKVRRSSDSTTLDIGFDGTGWLDTAAMLTFVGAGDGFVDTWYDQSASGLNVTASSTANQARVVLAGVVDTLPNGKPTVTFQSAGNTRGYSHATGHAPTANCGAFAVVEKTNAAPAGNSYIIAGATGCMAMRFSVTTGYVLAQRSAQLDLTSTTVAPSAGMHAIACSFNADRADVYVDNTVTTGAVVPALTANVRAIGVRVTTDGFANQTLSPRYSEVLFWNSAISAGDIATLTAESQTVYGTP